MTSNLEVQDRHMLAFLWYVAVLPEADRNMLLEEVTAVPEGGPRVMKIYEILKARKREIARAFVEKHGRS